MSAVCCKLSSGKQTDNLVSLRPICEIGWFKVSVLRFHGEKKKLDKKLLFCCCFCYICNITLNLREFMICRILKKKRGGGEFRVDGKK